MVKGFLRREVLCLSRCGEQVPGNGAEVIEAFDVFDEGEVVRRNEVGGGSIIIVAGRVLPGEGLLFKDRDGSVEDGCEALPDGGRKPKILSLDSMSDHVPLINAEKDFGKRAFGLSTYLTSLSWCDLYKICFPA